MTTVPEKNEIYKDKTQKQVVCVQCTRACKYVNGAWCGAKILTFDARTNECIY